MNLITRIFSKGAPDKDCPRCLGKGNVDWDDIKRLKKELRWLPGVCAYCNGVGKIDPKMEDTVAVDTTFLTNNLSKQERRRILNGDPAILERANLYDRHIDEFIKQICFLYFEGNLSANQIVDFFTISKSVFKAFKNEKVKLTDYIERVIQVSKSKN